MISGHGLITLPCTVNETLKMADIAAHLLCGNHFGGDRVASDVISLSHPASWDFGPRLDHESGTGR